MTTHQKGCKAKVTIPLFETFEVKDAQHRFLPFWQLLQRLLQYQHAQALAIIQGVLPCSTKGQEFTQTTVLCKM